jgi:DHA1 family tetracycline resistance protein-like MFS transporter
VLYASYRYGWQEQTMGLMLALIGVLSILVQGGLVRVVIPRIGERRALLTGLVCGMFGFLGYGLAPTGRLFVLATPVFSIMGLYGPSAQGLMTKRVSHSEQGQLSGANSSVMGITGMIGPTMFTVTFATFIGSRASWHLPGAPFFLASALMLVAAVIAWSVTRPSPAPARADAPSGA